MAVHQDASTGEIVNDGKDDKPTGRSVVMSAKVYSPFKVYYEGSAISVSAASAKGEFDILPRHHNFITLLVPCTLTVRNDDGVESFDIGGGIMHVKADEIVVFLDV